MPGTRSEYQDLMLQAGRLLGAFSRPFAFDAEGLVEAYQPFSDGLDYYRNTTPEHEKPQHRDTIVEALAFVEYQASWFVLRGWFDDEKIYRMEEHERNSRFLDLLYANKGCYSFFEAREKAIMALACEGIISYEAYGRY